MTQQKTTEVRLNALIRVLALLFIVVGAGTTYLTYTTPIAPQISPVFYLVSILLILIGFVTLISKLE